MLFVCFSYNNCVCVCVYTFFLLGNVLFDKMIHCTLRKLRRVCERGGGRLRYRERVAKKSLHQDYIGLFIYCMIQIQYSHWPYRLFCSILCVCVCRWRQLFVGIILGFLLPRGGHFNIHLHIHNKIFELFQNKIKLKVVGEQSIYLVQYTVPKNPCIFQTKAIHKLCFCYHVFFSLILTRQNTFKNTKPASDNNKWIYFLDIIFSISIY